MTYVITTACADVKHKACAAECPVLENRLAMRAIRILRRLKA